MEPRILFDVSTKPFDWDAVKIAAVLFVMGCVAILSERFKPRRGTIKYGGYVIAFGMILFAAYYSISWHLSRRDYVNALATGRYEVVEGVVEGFRPMYYERRMEESFEVSRHAFKYSDHVTTPCFNQPEAHGGPIHAGMMVRIRFINDCILQIEALSEKPASAGVPARVAP